MVLAGGECGAGAGDLVGCGHERGGWHAHTVLGAGMSGAQWHRSSRPAPAGRRGRTMGGGFVCAGRMVPFLCPSGAVGRRGVAHFTGYAAPGGVPWSWLCMAMTDIATAALGSGPDQCRGVLASALCGVADCAVGGLGDQSWPCRAMATAPGGGSSHVGHVAQLTLRSACSSAGSRSDSIECQGTSSRFVSRSRSSMMYFTPPRDWSANAASNSCTSFADTFAAGSRLRRAYRVTSLA